VSATGAPASTTPAAATLRTGPVVLAAGVIGFGVMAAELTAVRLLAPHFGDSAYVWTNVIGVILAAMAIGATLGGRLSARATADRWPFRLLLTAGALLAVAPVLTGWLGQALLPDDLPLDAAMPALIRGSLVATALVFAPPLLLLSAISPLLIVGLARAGKALGRAAGDVAAAGTVGSLIGTFAATHWLVPGFGCRVSLWLCAGALLLAAALVAPRRRAGTAAAMCLLPLAVALLDGGPLRAVPVGSELLAERETPYQYLQVQRTPGGERPARTTLSINEGLDSFHSLHVAGSAFTDGAYYDWHAVAPWLTGAPQQVRALSIGDAAGTLRQIYAAVHPGVLVDAVDIDPETMALGDEWFPGPKADGARYAVDGRVFLELSTERWHVIHVDAYAHQVYVPAHLASREFFTAARERLHDGGVLCCNVGALQLDDPVLAAIGRTVADVFEHGHVRVFKVPQSRNALLVARRGAALQPRLLAEARTPASLSSADRDHLRGILQTMGEPSNWHEPAESDVVLRDDRPVLDELLLDSYVDDGDPRAAVVCSGGRNLADAETTALQALQRSDWHAVLAAVRESRAESAFLRRMAGDARWYMRQLHSAVAEYEQGLTAASEPEMQQSLQARLEAAEAERLPTLHAEQAASRNGWLALAAVGLLAIGALFVRRV